MKKPPEEEDEEWEGDGGGREGEDAIMWADGMGGPRVTAQ